MREILFRGQTRKLGEKVRVGDGAPVPGHWVYGGILQASGDRSIIYAVDESGHFDGKYPVYSDTVGQYTGLKDKNGKKIFEGDIVSMPRYGGGKRITNVYFRGGKFAVDGSNYGFKDIATGHMEVVGNIYDNHELLEEN